MSEINPALAALNDELNADNAQNAAQDAKLQEMRNTIERLEAKVEALATPLPAPGIERPSDATPAPVAPSQEHAAPIDNTPTPDPFAPAPIPIVQTPPHDPPIAVSVAPMETPAPAPVPPIDATLPVELPAAPAPPLAPAPPVDAPPSDAPPVVTPAPVPLPVALVETPAPVEPAADAVPELAVVQVIPNDDSALVILPELDTIPGAADFRVYDAACDCLYKGAGIRRDKSIHPQTSVEPYAIEWNGIAPEGAWLIAEAVDALCPFMPHDDIMPTMDGAMESGVDMVLNGQGDPANKPIALARSKPFFVKPVSYIPTAQDMFVDLFHDDDTFIEVAIPGKPTDFWCDFYGNPQTHQRFRSKRWQADFLGHARQLSSVFFEHGHLMWKLGCGGPGSDIGNNNSSVVLTPLNPDGSYLSVDISDGARAQLLCEIDAHTDDNRTWISLEWTPVEDELNAGKLDGVRFRTRSGYAVENEIKGDYHHPSLFRRGPKGEYEQHVLTQWTDFSDSLALFRSNGNHTTEQQNGTMQDIDKRHRHELSVSQSAFAVREWDARKRLICEYDRHYPADVSLPVSLVVPRIKGQLYETAHRFIEMNADPDNLNEFWRDHSTHFDLRHLDNVIIRRIPAGDK